MPEFDLRGIRAGKYVNTDGVVTYTGVQKVGDAMTANLELRYAEGRLYAESSLAEYLKKAVGGTISLGVKYIPAAAQKLLFGSRENTRNVSYTPAAGGEATQASVVGLAIGALSRSQYVGVGLYAPDMIDGVQKFTCVKIAKALFGPPSMSLRTASENIQFNTPTTSGEFMADDTSNQDMLEVAIVDDENAALAWLDDAIGALPTT